MALSRAVGLDGEPRVAGVEAGGRELRDAALEQAVDLLTARRMVAVEAITFGRSAQYVHSGLVQAGQGAEGAGDQMQLVLDDQLRRLDTVEVAVEQRGGLLSPRQRPRTCRPWRSPGWDARRRPPRRRRAPASPGETEVARRCPGMSTYIRESDRSTS